MHGNGQLEPGRPKMIDLKASSRAITILLRQRSNVLDGLVIAAKVFVLVGTGLIGLAKIANWPALTTYISVCVVLASGLFTLIAERRASTTLAEARSAMDAAIEKDSELQNLLRKSSAAEDFYRAEIKRLSHIQTARDAVRALLEEVATSEVTYSETVVIDLILKSAKREWFLAHGFEMNDFYTICVYERVVNAANGNTELVCRAHIRAIDCDLKQARVWKEGVGVAGSALASGDEVVVEDLNDAALGSLYRIPQKKSDDEIRYRSIVAEPIRLDSQGPAWGVLVATSSKVGHFSLGKRDYVNVCQSLAGMIALGVKIVRSKATHGAGGGTG
jgi:hypothetical protein